MSFAFSSGFVVECLERRRLFAAVSVSGILGNALTVEGDDGPNVITISRSGDSVVVVADGERSEHPVSDLRYIDVRGLGGNDIIEVIETSSNRLEIYTILDGGEGDDILTGGAEAGVLRGGAGDDNIDGGDGFNIITGGHGSDDITGGAQNDLVFAGEDDDIVTTFGGDDVIWAGAGDDEVDAGGDNDFLYGGEGNDLLVSQSGNNWLDGGGGNDRITAGPGNDTLIGGAGADTLDPGDGENEVDEEEFNFWRWLDNFFARLRR